jgi:hypothetical protein
VRIKSRNQKEIWHCVQRLDEREESEERNRLTKHQLQRSRWTLLNSLLFLSE